MPSAADNQQERPGEPQASPESSETDTPEVALAATKI